MTTPQTWAHRLYATALATAASRPGLGRRQPGRPRDRGDVPGWVMITMMTAIVVIVLLGVFQEAVVNAVRNAFDSISGQGGGNSTGGAGSATAGVGAP